MAFTKNKKPCKAPDIGDPVLFYPHATRDDRVLYGVITEVNGYVVEICVTSSNGSFVRESVRHVDDDVLLMNEHLREFGGWDYVPLVKQILMLQTVIDHVQERFSNGQPTHRAKRVSRELAEAASSAEEEIESGADVEESELVTAE